MEEIYQVKISSDDLISGTSTNGLYEINWSDFLPKNAEKYLINTYFYTPITTNIYQANLQVHSDLMLNGFSYDTTRKSRSTLLSVIRPILTKVEATNAEVEYYLGIVSDKEWSMINYPQQNQIQIQIYDVNNTILSSSIIEDWTLIIYIKPIAYRR